MQGVLKLITSIVYADSKRAKDICMKRQQFLEDWVAYAKYTPLQQVKYADIPAQANWSKIMLDECAAFIHANMFQKMTRCEIKFLQQTIG